MGYIPSNLAGLSGPLLTDDQVTKMTETQNATISATAAKLKRPLTTAEKVRIISEVQMTYGLKPRFAEPIPSTLTAYWKGIQTFIGTAAYRATLGLPSTASDAAKYIVNVGSGIVGAVADGIVSAFSSAADKDPGVQNKVQLGKALLFGGAAIAALYFLSKRPR